MYKRSKYELATALTLGALGFLLLRRPLPAAMSALAGGLLLATEGPDESLEGHSVVITGGSRGLGFALARELLKEKAKVTILARKEEELDRAKQLLEEESSQSVHTRVCDVTKSDELELALMDASDVHGGIDLLINNAGAILAGPWETMEQKDFEAQMDLHLFAVINATRAALPYLRKSSSGKRIVNICSMGGRVAAPHMLPYVSSKFALSGFSQGVGVELAKEGISVTTIYPTLMRTGSPIQAVFKGDHEKEFAWFQSADVFPGLSDSAQSAAKKIIRAAKERRWELTPSVAAKARMIAAAFFPEILADSLAGLNRLLPEGESRQRRTGAQSRALFDKSWWTRAFKSRAHKVEQKYNQRPSDDAEFNLGLH